MNKHITVRQDVVMYAMYHDLAEAVIGDMPTPTKDKLGILGRGHLEMVERQVCFNPGTTFSEAVVKWADMVEALTFIRENGMGRHATRVRTKLALRLLDGLDEEPDLELSAAVRSVLSDIEQGDFVI